MELDRFKLGVESDGDDSVDEVDDAPAVTARSNGADVELALEEAAAVAAAMTAATDVKGGVALPLLFSVAPKVRV